MRRPGPTLRQNFARVTPTQRIARRTCCKLSFRRSSVAFQSAAYVCVTSTILRAASRAGAAVRRW
eukprot:3063840-Prymnesium_polylepis.1